MRADISHRSLGHLRSLTVVVCLLVCALGIRAAAAQTLPVGPYFLSNGEGYEGPFNLRNVRFFIDDGQVDGDWLVWFDGLEEWTSLSAVATLYAAVEEPPAPAAETDASEFMIGDWKADLLELTTDAGTTSTLETFMSFGEGGSVVVRSEKAVSENGEITERKRYVQTGTFTASYITSDKIELIISGNEVSQNPDTGEMTDWKQIQDSYIFSVADPNTLDSEEVPSLRRTN